MPNDWQVETEVVLAVEPVIAGRVDATMVV